MYKVPASATAQNKTHQTSSYRPPQRRGGTLSSSIDGKDRIVNGYLTSGDGKTTEAEIKTASEEVFPGALLFPRKKSDLIPNVEILLRDEVCLCARSRWFRAPKRGFGRPVRISLFPGSHGAFPTPHSTTAAITRRTLPTGKVRASGGIRGTARDPDRNNDIIDSQCGIVFHFICNGTDDRFSQSVKVYLFRLPI